MGLKEIFAKFFRIQDDYDYEIEYTESGEISNKEKIYASTKRERDDMAKINIIEPRVYSEVETIAALLIEKQAVLLNLRRVDEAQARRIIDYLAGIAYAVNGDVQKLSDDIFLCVPSNIEIEGMLNEELTSNRLDFLESM